MGPRTTGRIAPAAGTTDGYAVDAAHCSRSARSTCTPLDSASRPPPSSIGEPSPAQWQSPARPGEGGGNRARCASWWLKSAPMARLRGPLSNEPAVRPGTASAGGAGRLVAGGTQAWGGALAWGGLRSGWGRRPAAEGTGGGRCDAGGPCRQESADGRAVRAGRVCEAMTCRPAPGGARRGQESAVGDVVLVEDDVPRRAEGGRLPCGACAPDSWPVHGTGAREVGCARRGLLAMADDDDDDDRAAARGTRVSRQLPMPRPGGAAALGRGMPPAAAEDGRGGTGVRPWRCRRGLSDAGKVPAAGFAAPRLRAKGTPTPMAVASGRIQASGAAPAATAAASPSPSAAPESAAAMSAATKASLHATSCGAGPDGAAAVSDVGAPRALDGEHAFGEEVGFSAATFPGIGRAAREAAWAD